MTLMALFAITSGCAYGMEGDTKQYTIFAVAGNEFKGNQAGIVCVKLEQKSEAGQLTLPDSKDYEALTKNRGHWIFGKNQTSIKMNAHVFELCKQNRVWIPIATLDDLTFCDDVLKDKKIDSITITTIKNIWEKVGTTFKQLCTQNNNSKDIYNLQDLYQVLPKIEKDAEESEKEKELAIITKDLKKVADDELLLEISFSEGEITVDSMHVPTGLCQALDANKITIDGTTYYTIAAGNPNLQTTKRTHVAMLWEIANEPNNFLVGYNQKETETSGNLYYEDKLKKIVNFHKNPKKFTTNQNVANSIQNPPQNIIQNNPQNHSSSSSMGPVVGLVSGGIGIFGAYMLYKWLKKSDDKK